MKHFFPIIIVLALIAGKATAQNANVTGQADRMAQRMQDSLGVSPTVRRQLYEINISLALQKQQLRGLGLQADTLRVRTQRIENTRDSLYAGVLNNDQYQRYINRKLNLVKY